jgi:hypothetical protein
VILAIAVALLALIPAATASATTKSAGRWVAGDIHTHTWLTDGKNTQGEVVRNAFENYGLDYFANSEHGGYSTYDPSGTPFDFAAPILGIPRWITLSNYSYPIIQDLRQLYPERKIIQGLEWNAPTHEHVSVGIVGAENEPKGISDFEYRFDAADLDTSRANEGIKAITHAETFTTVIAASPAGATETGNTVTITTLDFHHLAIGDTVTIAGVGEAGYNGTFTVASVTDTTFTYADVTSGLAASGDGTVAQKVTITDQPAVPFDKKNVTADDTIAAIDWLNDTFSTQAYAIVNHPSRAQLWHVGDFRAMNDAAPDVAFGFEGLPGHQADQARGGYNYTFADPAVQLQARTYGGADYMTAKVGGLWDSLLGEGRHWWIFNNSDYHRYQNQYKDAAGSYYDTQYYDFWPGQYAKTWTYVNRFNLQGVVDGMRRGDVFDVNGDLITALDYTATDGKHTATMGGTLNTKAGKVVTVRIAMRSPRMNNHGDQVKVNHVDVIAGKVTGMIDPSNPLYASQDTNSSAKVIKTVTRFTSSKGWRIVTFKVKATTDMYFRLRGTNLARNTPNETDAQGNPIVDEQSYVDIPNPDPTKVATIPTLHVNTPALAWGDLWFYSNPIFLHVSGAAK